MSICSICVIILARSQRNPYYLSRPFGSSIQKQGTQISCARAGTMDRWQIADLVAAADLTAAAEPIAPESYTLLTAESIS